MREREGEEGGGGEGEREGEEEGKLLSSLERFRWGWLLMR